MSLLDALLLDPYRINAWIARRADGIAGTGTQSDPYDGSTAVKFDTLMNSLAVNTCVHLGPGEFETAGHYDGQLGAGWQPKSGMRIVGSGIDVTTLKVVNSTATTQRVYAIAHVLTQAPGAPLVTVTSLDYLRQAAGWVGFEFLVGSTPLTVTELGRWVVGGNSASHTVKLFNADGTDVLGGSVTVNTLGQAAAQFAYMPLATPVTLAANTTYAVMSYEVQGGDEWHEYFDTLISLSGAASAPAAVYAETPPPPYIHASSGQNRSYVPVDLRYRTAGSAVTVDFFEVCDLTIDCNLAGVTGTSSTAGAVRIMGNHSRVVRVKVINWGNKSTGTPGYVIAMLTGEPNVGLNGVINCGIEECIAISPHTSSVGPVTVLHVGGREAANTNEEAFGLGPYLRNCFVDCGQTTDFTKDYRALSMAWCKGGIVEGNQVHNTKHGGPYQDQTGARDLAVRQNVYRNVYRGPYWSLAAQGVQKLVVEDNSIELNTAAPNSQYAIQLDSSGAPPTYVHGSVIIRNNRIRYVDGASGLANGIRVYNAQNLLVRENVIELAPAQPQFPLNNKNCGSVEYFENRTPAGVLLRGYNESNGILYSELETEAEDAFLLGMLKRA